MVNLFRTKEMIALSMYDEGSANKDRRLLSYYRSDYIALKMIGSAFATTCGYLLILLLLAAGNAETILSALGSVSVSGVIRILTVLYAVLLAANLIGTWISAARRCKAVQKKQDNYRRHLENLRKLDS